MDWGLFGTAIITILTGQLGLLGGIFFRLGGLEQRVKHLEKIEGTKGRILNELV